MTDCVGGFYVSVRGDHDIRGAADRVLADKFPDYPGSAAGRALFNMAPDCDGSGDEQDGYACDVRHNDPDDGSEPVEPCLMCHEPSVYTSPTGVDLCAGHLADAQAETDYPTIP